MSSQFPSHTKIQIDPTLPAPFHSSLSIIFGRKQPACILRKRESVILNKFPWAASAALLLFSLLLSTMFLYASQKWAEETSVDGDPIVAGLPYDAIPAITNPVFVSRAEAESFMTGGEPVVGIYDGKIAKAYPAWLLNGHEIVNDTLAVTPIAATW
ncbi:MAG: DUF3179 domain-containing protein [Acidobacteria bacterium]|nr:DUF3179 domain-containing protein [Acidobacteriota bacterium]